MKKYLTYAIAACFATIVVANASPEADMIITKEKAAWQAFKDKKADDFKKLLAPNMVAVYSDGFFTLQHELDLMAKVDMKSFSLSDINVTMTDADTAIITCKATVESSMAGKDTSHESNSGSVWKKTGGEWRAIFHADMKVEAPALDAQKKE